MTAPSFFKPSSYYKLGRKGLLPLIIITLAAAILLLRLETKHDAGLSAPPNDSYLTYIEEKETLFDSGTDFILLTMEEGTVQKTAALTEELMEFPGIGPLLSPVNMSDIRRGSDTLDFEPLLADPETPGAAEELRTIIKDTTLFRKLFLGKNSSLGLYILPETGYSAEKLAGELLRWAEHREGIHLSGYPVISSIQKSMMRRDTLLLIPLALSILFAAEFILFRNLKSTILLTLACLLPTLWVLGLFPAMNIPLTMNNISVPVIVLALSTSYGLHLFRYSAAFPKKSMSAVLNEVGAKITVAAVTTILGFVTILFSSSRTIMEFGVPVILGVVFALLFCLYFLPILSGKIHIKPILQDRQERLIPGPGTERIIIAAGITLLLLLGSGLPRLKSDSRIEKVIQKNHPYQTTLAFFNETYGGLNEMEIFIDTGMEYGILEPEFTEGLIALIEELENHPETGTVLSYLDFVDWIDSRLGGPGLSNGAVPGMETVGESLELLFGRNLAGIDLGSMVNSSYSEIRVTVRYAFGSKDSSFIEALETYASTAIARCLPEKEFIIGGSPLVNNYLFNDFKTTMIRGLILFFPLTLLILIVVHRSAGWTLLTILAPATGTLIYLGTMGWTGMALNLPTMMCITCILGVCLDDAVFLTMTLKEKLKHNSHNEALRLTLRQTGGAIIDTTLLICVVISSFLLSQIQGMVHVGILITLSMLGTTAYTLFLLPILARFFYPDQNSPENPALTTQGEPDYSR